MGYSLLAMKEMICNFTNLQLCYDRQLSKVGSIREESTEKKAMHLFTKIIPYFKHYTNKGYRMWDGYYGRDNIILEETGSLEIYVIMCYA